MGWLAQLRYGRLCPWGIVDLERDGDGRIVGMTAYGHGKLRRVRFGRSRWPDVLWNRRVARRSPVQLTAGRLGDVIVAPRRRHGLLALDRQHGERVWEDDLDGELPESVVATGDGMLQVTTPRRTCSFDPSSGERAPHASPAPTDPVPLDGTYVHTHERASVDRPVGPWRVELVPRNGSERPAYDLRCHRAEGGDEDSIELGRAAGAALSSVTDVAVVQLWNRDAGLHGVRSRMAQGDQAFGELHVLIVDPAARRIVAHFPTTTDDDRATVRDRHGERIWRGTV